MLNKRAILFVHGAWKATDNMLERTGQSESIPRTKTITARRLFPCNATKWLTTQNEVDIKKIYEQVAIFTSNAFYGFTL